MSETTNKLNHWGGRIYDNVRLMLPTEIFSEMRRGGMTFNYLNQNLEEWLDWRNKTMQVAMRSDSYFLSYNGHNFKFMISYKKFCLWNESGLTSLGTYEINTSEPPTNEFVDWLNKTLQNYEQGIIRCSDCGVQMKGNEIAGRYFAGVYCKNCWKSKWQAIEAAEDYN